MNERLDYCYNNCFKNSDYRKKKLRANIDNNVFISVDRLYLSNVVDNLRSFKGS